MADREGLPVFVEASPFGYEVYRRGGFEVVEVVDVDLRGWGKREVCGLGRYRTWFMGWGVGGGGEGDSVRGEGEG